MKDQIKSSFGRRRGRKLGPEVAANYESLYSNLSINADVKYDDLQDLFPKALEEFWMEIGFGGGEHLNQQLSDNQSVGIIGCEPYMNGVAKLLFNLNDGNDGRLKIWQEDVRLLIPQLPKEQLSRIYILFPDPWHKKRHNDRRLVTVEFVDILSSLLKTGGQIRLATDDYEYALQMMEAFSKNKQFNKLFGPDSEDTNHWPERPEWPQTKYETRAFRLGKPCAYFIFEKR